MRMCDVLKLMDGLAFPASLELADCCPELLGDAFVKSNLFRKNFKAVEKVDRRRD